MVTISAKQVQNQSLDQSINIDQYKSVQRAKPTQNPEKARGINTAYNLLR
jgi:hypothetical protein